MNKPFYKRWYVWVIALIFIMLAIDSMEDSPAQSGQKKESVRSGDQAILNNQAYVPVDENAQDEMYGYINSKNNDAIMRMIERGQMFVLNKDAEVTVVKLGFITAEIEDVETGKRGLIPVEFLTKK